MNVLITGATSGIGLELTKLYANEKGTKLALLGRKPLQQLDKALFNTGNYCQVDLATGFCTDLVLNFLERVSIAHLNILVHNAGIGYFGRPEDQLDESIIEILKVNLYTPLRLSHALMPLIKKVKGKIILVSSVAVYLPTPDYAVYTASKAALDGFARSLRAEGKVRVQVIHPGATKTAMAVKSGLPPEKINDSKWLSAAEVAKHIKSDIETSDLDGVIGLVNKTLRLIGYYFAWLIDSALLWQKKS